MDDETIKNIFTWAFLIIAVVILACILASAREILGGIQDILGVLP